MAHTFDIRFARSASFAGFFGASSNSFGWRGDGRLSIDSMGLEVGVKRGFTSLFVRRRSHRIPVDQIREVYREGDALRIEFSNGARPREVLPLWARDRGSAAQIVELLPTRNTIELEQAPSEPDVRPAAPLRRLLLPGLLTVLLLVPVTLWLKRERPASISPPPVARPPGRSPAAIAPQPGQQPASATNGPPEAVVPDDAGESATATAQAPAPPAARPDSRSTTRQPVAAAPVSGTEPDPDNFVPTVPEIELRAEDLVVPLRQGSLAYDSARDVLKRFEQMASQLGEKYRRQRQLSDSGELGADAYADSLQALESQWRTESVQLLNPGDAKDPALTGFLTTLGAVVAYQSSFLSGYAAAVRARDANAIRTAFEDLARAERMLERARLYVR